MNEAEKQAYREKMEAKLDKLKADIQRLEAEAKEKKADVKAGTHAQLSELREKSDKMRTRLTELKGQSGEAWQETRTALSNAWEELSAGLSKAANHLKK